MNFKSLELVFNNAKLLTYKYVAVLSTLPYGSKPELRIHMQEDFDIALKEYKKRYGNNLKHAFANVQIVDAKSGNSLAEFEPLLEQYENKQENKQSE